MEALGHFNLFLGCLEPLKKTQRMSFWDDFSNDTIKKYAVIHFFVIVLPKWKNNNLCSDASS